MIKSRIYVEWHFKTDICTKFHGFSLNNSPRNTKTDRLIKWFIMHISNEADPP